MEKRLKIQIPSVPNFIKVGEQMVSIKDFSEEELTDIAEAWCEKLKEKANPLEE